MPVSTFTMRNQIRNVVFWVLGRNHECISPVEISIRLKAFEPNRVSDITVSS